jgi:hypothetical protein
LPISRISRHLVNRIDARARIGGVRRLAEGLHHNLRPAALPALQIQLGRFADHNVVGLDALADLSCGNALEAFLVNNSGDIDLSREISLRVRGKEAAAAIMALTAPFMSEAPRP